MAAVKRRVLVSVHDVAQPENERARGPVTSAALFALAWETLVDMLGSATAATLMRQAAARAALQFGELKEFSVARDRLEYRCALPDAWRTNAPADALRQLFAELRAILLDLTGAVVVERLCAVPELAASGLFASEEVGT
jgi:hypothetical protein